METLCPARDGAPRRPTELWLVALWGVAALALALWRTPYDDEWFTLTLVAETDATGFWGSLGRDVHPIWAPLVDRGLWSLFGHRAALNLLRVLAMAAGLLLVLRTVRRRLAWSPLWTLAAALHPVVFYYAGAVRWYPLLFLAQALRLYGLWGAARPGSGRALGAFAGGAVLGPMTSYVDTLFVAADGLWLLIAGLGGGRWRRVVAVLAAAAAIDVLVLLVASPLGLHLDSANSGWVFGADAARNLVTWGGLGLVGEAHPPWPLALAALAVLPAYAWGLVRLVRPPADLSPPAGARRFAAWLLTTAALWTLASAFTSVGHPRYSLLLWLLLAAAALQLLRRPGPGRWLAVAAAAYLTVGLGLAVSGRGFVKGDLNRLGDEVCDHVQAAGVDLVVAPYPRTAELIGRDCEAPPPVVTARHVRHFLDEAKQLAPLARRLAEAPRVLLVTREVRDSSLAVTNWRVQRLLAGRCAPRPATALGAAPHLALKRLLDPSTPASEYLIQPWECAP